MRFLATISLSALAAQQAFAAPAQVDHFANNVPAIVDRDAASDAAILAARDAGEIGADEHFANDVPEVDRSHEDEELDARGLGDFTVTQVKRAGKGPPMSGPDALTKAYHKYGKPVPGALIKAAKNVRELWHAKRAATMKGTVKAVPPGGYDYEYVSPVQIGTPPQTVYLDFDTGSSDLWTMSSDTPSRQVAGQAIYNPKKSKSAKVLKGQTWDIHYGDGTGASGKVYSDRVAIGAAVVNNQAVESATQVSQGFTDDQAMAGILGLGFGVGNTVRPTKQKTFMDNVVANLAGKVFTANLKRGVAGNYNFGYISKAEYTGNIQYAPIDRSSTFWKFYPTGYRVGTGAIKRKAWPAIVDTGTTLLLLPNDIVTAYYKSIRGAKYDNDFAGYVFPCNVTPPQFQFAIGGYLGTVPGSYMNYGHVDSTYCYGGIQSSDQFGFSIFGDILLKAQFVVFDYGNKRVGFANKRLTT